MRLPVLIFDFGNVISFFDYAKIYGRLGARIGISADQFRETMERNGFTRLLQTFESGDIAPEDFAAAMTGLAGLKLPFEAFVDDWSDIFEINQPVADLAAFLKGRGYTLLVGSNTNVLHAGYYRRRYAEALAPFDQFIFSHDVRRMKPHREFFEACLTAAGAPGRSTVFIDDIEENVEGARQAGLIGLLYRDTPGLIEDLRRLDVEVPAVPPE